MTTIPGSSAIEDWFPTRIMDRGQDYFLEGRVHIVEGGDGWLRTKVRGTRTYDVSIIQHPKTHGLEVRCTCPYGRDHGACKHIWACLLAGLDYEFLYLPDNLLPPDLDDVCFELPSLRVDGWQHVVDRLGDQTLAASRAPTDVGPDDRIIYVVDRAPRVQVGGLLVDVMRQRRRKDGTWGEAKPLTVRCDALDALPDDDRGVLATLGGAIGAEIHGLGRLSRRKLPATFDVAPALARSLLPRICRTGRCYLGHEQVYVRRGLGPAGRLVWEDDPWMLRLGVARARIGGEARYRLGVTFVRGADERSLDEVALVAPGFLVWNETVAPLTDFGAFDWIAHVHAHGPIVAGAADGEALVARVLETVGSPPLDPPPELRFEALEVAPLPRLHVRLPGSSTRGKKWHLAELTFGYPQTVVGEHHPSRRLVDEMRRRVVARDFLAERRARERLLALSFTPARRQVGRTGSGLYDIREKLLTAAVRALVSEGWSVEAAGFRYRAPGAFNFSVTSGVDWFDLEGEIDFGDTSLSIPELLAAHRRGETTVRLGDGSVGLLPEAWLERYASVAELGHVENDRIRFRPSQVAVLDALLAAQPTVSVDEQFEKARDALQSFEGVTPADPPESFRGRLRAYQREGLGWMHFLATFGLGGCLADDMGLGKTVQVLALLDAHRVAPSPAAVSQDPAKGRASTNRGASVPRPARKPCIVVAPRSLVFNWRAEAARFTPELDVREHVGTSRARTADAVADCDVVLTTYGTLKRDIGFLKDVAFDVVVIDESQAIKNPTTAAAKAVRLLRGDHRLALSGTPIENHVGELWSLFEFLNPGMLGSTSAFRRLGGGKPGPTGEDVALIAQAVRPLVLRRTKSQVARDLPAKVEQSLVCELGREQRRLYDELRDHYRASLSEKIETHGLAKSKILVLEALLRLRQAACHAGLVDAEKRGVASAKLDVLADQLESVMAEGHKALVFSQFTSLLSIVRERLEQEDVGHAYLDGRTRKRQAQVEAFQNDPECKLFLISLKAGGVGLNLTAAEYVYLLDPWWNPAVELQAIDRTHRIGQTRQVFAYRLIARDTVEEKIIELQARKRELADSIIKADAGLIRSLNREDLELLLS